MRYQLTEYGQGIKVDDVISNGITVSELYNDLDNANKRIRNALGTKTNVFFISNQYIVARGITGVIKLNSFIELEVIPKFYSNNDESWKKTVYLLATLSKHGKILSKNKINSSLSSKDTLLDIASRIIAEEFLSNKRKPIRNYRIKSFCDFGIEGELNFETFFERNPNGFSQTIVTFDKRNPYNAIIKKAVEIVLPYAKDHRTENILQSALNYLGSQNPIPNIFPTLPVRNKEWALAYELSQDIIHGLSLAFNNGSFFAPGFIASTWQMWEWLITTGFILGTKGRKIKSQLPVKAGQKYYTSQVATVNVFPDITIFNNDDLDKPIYLVDAKYKLLENEITGEISKADLYEAYTFCQSLKTNTIFLVYPSQAENNEVSGTVSQKAFYSFLGVSIYVVKIVLGNINEKNGFLLFAEKMSQDIELLFNSNVNL